MSRAVYHINFAPLGIYIVRWPKREDGSVVLEDREVVAKGIRSLASAIRIRDRLEREDARDAR